MLLKHDSVLPPHEEAMVTNCIGVGIAVHRALGPGFKEKIYHRAYTLELDSRGMSFEAEKEIEVVYRSWRIPGQRIDLIVEGVVLVEVKAVRVLKSIHEAQVRSYFENYRPARGLVDEFQLSRLEGWTEENCFVGLRVLRLFVFFVQSVGTCRPWVRGA